MLIIVPAFHRRLASSIVVEEKNSTPQSGVYFTRYLEHMLGMLGGHAADYFFMHPGNGTTSEDLPAGGAHSLKLAIIIMVDVDSTSRTIFT